MKNLPPAPYKNKYWDVVEKKILKIFDDMLYRELFALTRKQEELYNNKNDLVTSIIEGNIAYRNGSFSGAFNSTTSKELRAIGAKYDKKSRTWKLPRKSLPPQVISSLALRDAKDQSLNNQIIAVIDDVNINQVIADANIPASYRKTISGMNKDIGDTLKAVGVKAVLSRAESEIISEQWAENLDLYIKGFAEQNILQLRQKIEQNTASGRRAENMVKAIQQSYGVTRSKAKFLARQETSLLMSKMRETRYKGAGVQRYRWSTSKDGRVREDHRDLQGKIFSWDNPPITDDLGNRNHPGEDFGCRCVPIPILEGSE